MGKSNFQKLIIVINIITVIIFLIFRFQYGMNRYFDIDEFAHLHWSHNLLAGLAPYTDFFYFFPPLYLYFLIPLFWLSGKSVAILLLSRGFSFGIFLLVLLVLFVLVRRIRNTHVALLSVLILSFLPIPSDKWIEVRPDGIAMLFSLLGMMFLVSGIQKRKAKDYFLSGLFYALGVILMPKMIFLAIVGLIVVLLIRLRIKEFIIGGILPIVLTFLLFISYGDLGKSFLLVTKVASDASRVLGNKFPIPPNFLFYPNDIYYGVPGFSLPWFSNLIIWFFAIIWGIVRLVSFLDKKEKKESLIEFLLTASFLVSLVAYVAIFPLRHAQYLMPISVFIAFYFTDFIVESAKVSHGFFAHPFVASLLRASLPKQQSVYPERSEGLKKHGLPADSISNIFVFLVVLALFLSGKQMYDAKLRWPGINMQYYRILFNLLPEKEKVYDLTGETIFSPDGYYFCCIPYGQYEEVLGQKPDLERELRQNRVKFVYMQNEGRLSVLPQAHDKVLRKYYTIYPSGNPPFLLVSGALVNIEDGLGKEFDLIAGGKYLLIWNNKILTAEQLLKLVEIDGKKVKENPVNLSEGIHKITVSEKGLMKIMYSW